MQKTRVRLPLQVTISTLFISLSIVLGALLSIQNYDKTSKILLTSAQKVYERLTEELILDIRGTYTPLTGILRTLALSPVTTARTLEDRLVSLQTFCFALANSPAATNLQIAYANGDYFTVRKLDSNTLKESFKAPPEADYLVDHIDTGPAGRRRLKRLFIGGRLDIIAEEPARDTDYDPTLRKWYRDADTEPVATKPYLFYFTRQVGITARMKTSQPGVVVAIDITLDRLSNTIDKYDLTPESEAALVNAEGQTFAYRHPEKIILQSKGKPLALANLDQLGSEVLSFVSKDLQPIEQDLDFTFNNQQWVGRVRLVGRPGGVDLFALILSPVDELLSEASEIRKQSFLATVLITLFFIPLIGYASKRIADPLVRLAGAAFSITKFEFDDPIETTSYIREVHDLSVAMNLMQTTINKFIRLINSLAGEQNLDSLLDSISRETMVISRADGVLAYLMNEDESVLNPGSLCSRKPDRMTTDGVPPLVIAEMPELSELFVRNESSTIVLDSSRRDAFNALPALFGTARLTLIAIPLINRNFENVGLLCLLFKQAEGVSGEADKAGLSFIRALSGFAAVTLESRQLLHRQEALLNAFIKLIAGAIDAKSPYTGGHCQRVPELTRMLARAACESAVEPFTDFNLSDRDWEALEIASWLHDCGKVTTPEFVVDKATKLETLYDRIHEVRMRFEVLKRDAEIGYWRQRAAGGDKDTLDRTLNETLRQLDDDFAFLAECNQGGESMDDEKIERIHRIAQRTWMRTLDDRIGVSWEEARRKSRNRQQALPVEEHVLSDKAEHIVERKKDERLSATNPWGFKLDIPEHKYNRGELYNLSVRRGTLNAEERYLINDHITQTIIMLEKLPFPRHLRGVPEIAGGHHETMDGRGYPRRLKRDELSLPARMLAIADIFEALTASDRPYKKAKTLSEALRILRFLREDHHIDPDLFELFLRSGIHEQYGKRYLQPDQLDAVDITELIGKP